MTSEPSLTVLRQSLSTNMIPISSKNKEERRLSQVDNADCTVWIILHFNKNLCTVLWGYSLRKILNCMKYYRISCKNIWLHDIY